MAEQRLSAHAEWSMWWDHSWQSATLRFQLLIATISHCSMTGQAPPSQPWPQALVQTTTHAPSTTAASQSPHTSDLGLDVSTQTSVLFLDAHTQTAQPSPTLLRDASTQAAPHSVAYKDASTQLSFFRVLPTELPLHDTTVSIESSSPTWGHQRRPQSQQY